MKLGEGDGAKLMPKGKLFGPKLRFEFMGEPFMLIPPKLSSKIDDGE